MAKRLSSIFSLGSNSSDASTNDSRARPVCNPDHPTNDRPQSAMLASPRSTPDLRPITPTSRYQDRQYIETTGGAPPLDTSRLSPMMASTFVSNEANGQFPPGFQKPLPQPAGLNEFARPASRASGAGSRASAAGSRASSRDGNLPNSRAVSPARFTPTTPTAEHSKLSKRRSWLPGGNKNRSDAEGECIQQPAGFQAWNIAYRSQDNTYYDLAPLCGFQKVPELWNDACDTYIHLHDKSCEKGPSIKIDSSLFASSRRLTTAAYGDVPHRNSHLSSQHRNASQDTQHSQLLESTSALRLESQTPPLASQPSSSTRSSSLGYASKLGSLDDSIQRKREMHVGITLELQTNTADPNHRLSIQDIDLLVTVRNAFALLIGLPLVATSTRPSIFLVFLGIAEFLHGHEFTNLDGSSLGEEVATAFAHCVAEFRMADVRASREKTLEAIILGERMKYWPLYNEGFVHAVGKYDSLVNLRSANFHLIPDSIHKRMEIASIELSRRQRNVQGRLQDFDFASMWSGIANSRTSSDSKGIRFKAWRAAFNDMRTHVISIYKERYGAWPPKARSKKNNFEESGLNRLLLRQLYNDLSDLYDALVDRTSLTTRHMEIPSSDESEDSDQMPTSRALRRLLSEYDRSTPPVQPPIPFDTPRLPTLTSIRKDILKLPPPQQKKEATRPLSTSEINLALLTSYNREHGQDPVKATPFIDAFTTFERARARGKSIEELTDLRVGQWIFLYAVIQALPPLVMDAPDLKFTQGVEYFLCSVPKGSAPWVQESYQQKVSWYGIQGGTGVVSLPADVVEHGVDGIYRRSHCWTCAEKWAGSLPTDPAYDNDNGGLSAAGAAPRQDYRRRHSSVSETPYQLQPGSPRLPYADELQPPIMPGSRPESRASSRSPNRDRRGSMALGLEQLPLPAGVSPTGSRPTSTYDPEASFDKILAAGAADLAPKKGKKK